MHAAPQSIHHLLNKGSRSQHFWPQPLSGITKTYFWWQQKNQWGSAGPCPQHKVKANPIPLQLSQVDMIENSSVALSDSLEFTGEVSRRCHHQTQVKLCVNTHEKWVFLNAAAFVLYSVTSSHSFLCIFQFLCVLLEKMLTNINPRVKLNGR